MDGLDDCRRGLAAEAQIGGGQPGLPIVQMHDFWREIGHKALGERRGDLRQGGEALGVVGVIQAVQPEVGAARPQVEMRRIEDEKRG